MVRLCLPAMQVPALLKFVAIFWKMTGWMQLSSSVPISSTIPGGNSTYTDVNYSPYPNADYRVDVTWGLSCSPTRTTISTTRSNIKHQSISSGINSGDENWIISIYPNPANESVILELSKNTETTTLKIINVLGQLMDEETVPPSTTKTTKQIDIKNYAKGIYTICIENNGLKKYKKLVVN